MVTFNWSLCVLCASLSVVASIPLTSFGTKQLGDSKHLLPSKFQTFPGKSSSFNSKNSSRLPPLKQKETLDSSEDGGDAASKAIKQLSSITDRMLQTNEFASNGSIDYSAMAPSKPVQVVPDYYYDTDEDYDMDSTEDYDYLEKKAEADKARKVGSSNPSESFDDLSFQEKHERAQIIRINEVKESILAKLRLIAPPNITALKLNNQLKAYPEHILPKLPDQSHLQQDDSRSQVDDFHAKISTVIQFASDFPASKHPERYPTDSIAYFILPLTVGEKNVQKATLMVYIATPDGEEGRHVQLHVSNTLYRNKPFVNRTVSLMFRGHWEHIDITQIVADWAADESENYGLYIVASLDGKNIAYLNDDPLEIEKEEVILNGNIVTRPHRTPLVKIILNEEQGRYKRSFDEVPLSCDINDQDQRCCRYKFSIEFEKLGKDFDFIIEPRRYWANYCAGSCPKYFLPQDGNTKLLMAFKKPKIERCCTATTKKSLNLLYYNENGGIMLGTLLDMSIEKCSCS